MVTITIIVSLFKKKVKLSNQTYLTPWLPLHALAEASCYFFLVLPFNQTLQCLFAAPCFSCLASFTHLCSCCAADRPANLTHGRDGHALLLAFFRLIKCQLAQRSDRGISYTGLTERGSLSSLWMGKGSWVIGQKQCHRECWPQEDTVGVGCQRTLCNSSKTTIMPPIDLLYAETLKLSCCWISVHGLFLCYNIRNYSDFQCDCDVTTTHYVLYAALDLKEHFASFAKE